MEEKKYKIGRKLTEFVCDYCGEMATKPTSEYNRNIKANKHNFCCRKCSVIYGNKHRDYSKKKTDKLKTYSDNRRDEFTPFRYTLRNAKKRFKEFDLDLEYLKKVWEDQNGICPYSKIKLILPEYEKTLKEDPQHRASLDRIDSSKGYVKGNIQFVSTSINYLKGEMSHEEITNFINEMVNNILLFSKDQTISSSQTEMLDAQAGN